VPGKSGTIEYTSGINIKSRKGEANVLSMIQDISNDQWNRWRAPNGEVFKCTTIKAVAIRDDGARSKVVTHSYFVDPQMNTRYTLPVISIVTDYDNFFDKSTGIYVNGNYENRGKEWERPVHIEYFETDGKLGFSMDMGLRIHGDTQESILRSLSVCMLTTIMILARSNMRFSRDLEEREQVKNKEFERLILRNAEMTGQVLFSGMK